MKHCIALQYCCLERASHSIAASYMIHTFTRALTTNSTSAKCNGGLGASLRQIGIQSHPWSWNASIKSQETRSESAFYNFYMYTKWSLSGLQKALCRIWMYRAQTTRQPSLAPKHSPYTEHYIITLYILLYKHMYCVCHAQNRLETKNPYLEPRCLFSTCCLQSVWMLGYVCMCLGWQSKQT
jgi:hypothetical protein